MDTDLFKLRGVVWPLVLVWPLSGLAGPPKTCLPDVAQAARLAQAQQVYRSGESDEAVRLWDDLLRDSAQGPPCRTVEIAWHIGEFLKVQKQEAPELALRLLNRGIAAHVKGKPAEDWSLGKVLKTTGHFFRRQGDSAGACRSLGAAWRIFSTLDGATAAREQTQAELVRNGCPVPTLPSP